jgi:hypothetical protein
MKPELDQITFNSRSGAQVAGLKPDFAAVAELQQPWLIATAPADASEYDFVSRFFLYQPQE